jgi:Terminase large subunit, T4likevirus-type, N-terminal
MKIFLKAAQSSVFACDKRFRVLVAGRRFGKTYLAMVELIRAAWGPGRLVWYVGPTNKQSKRIIWKSLKKMTKEYWASTPNETDLRIELVSGGTICLRGADNYDSLRGDGLDFVVLDEYASISRAAWTEVLRPALADREGGALFIGTPQGFNHFHELVDSAEGQPDWEVFQYTTAEGGNVSPKELESAAHELDERTYLQEFEAKFGTLGVGRAYYAFDRAHHVHNFRFNPHLQLCWSLDFNMNPLCSVLAQVQENGGVAVLEELILPDSNTAAACEEFLSRTAKWFSGTPSAVCVYGDSTGEQRRTSASRTDWQIVKDFFGRYPERFRATFRIPSANPPVKDRVNCVNAKLRNHAGQYRVLVNPSCKALIKDFEQVSWKTDPHGNPLVDLDKSDPMRTHVSDALGYLVAKVFPMSAQRGERSGPAIC